MDKYISINIIIAQILSIVYRGIGYRVFFVQYDENAAEQLRRQVSFLCEVSAPGVAQLTVVIEVIPAAVCGAVHLDLGAVSYYSEFGA